MSTPKQSGSEKSVFSGFLHVETKNIYKKVIAPGLPRGDSIISGLFLNHIALAFSVVRLRAHIPYF